MRALSRITTPSARAAGFLKRLPRCCAAGDDRRQFESTSKAQQQALVELREYDLFPAQSAEYMQTTAAASQLIKKHSPLRIYSLPETGGQLHTATSFYYYAGGFDERNATRSRMAQDTEFQQFLAESRPCVQAQRSMLFVEAPLEGPTGLAQVPELQPGEDSILEIRRYKLKLGYDTVPKFLDLYGTGLPSKTTAQGTDPTTSLVTLLYSEVGRLNEVIEIWRHGDGTKAMERSRVAARGAQEWRSAIASITDLAIEFTSTIHKSAPFSPIK